MSLNQEDKLYIYIIDEMINGKFEYTEDLPLTFTKFNII